MTTAKTTIAAPSAPLAKATSRPLVAANGWSRAVNVPKAQSSAAT